MFLALRDLRFASGRFALMGAVVALISLLLVMLSGLTAGLGRQNTDALDRLGASGVERIVYGSIAGQDPAVSFTQTEFTQDARQAWGRAAGVESVSALGVSQGRAIGLEHAVEPDASGRADIESVPTTGVASAAFLGLEPEGAQARALFEDAGPRPGRAVVSATVAEELGTEVGDVFSVAGFPLTVARIIPDEHYSHSPVVWLALEDWRGLAHVTEPGVLGTVGLARFAEGADVEQAAAAADAAAGTRSASVDDSYAALPSYQSENGSLMTMQGFLYGISALVVIAFLSIWTVQRTRDIAVLKALGGSDRWVLKDALVQAGLVLVAGVAVGTALAAGIGSFAARAVPFQLTWATTALPAAGILVLGMLAAVAAVVRVTRIDPLIALGGN